MMQTRRWLTAVATASAAALVLAGCSIQIQSAPDPSIPADTMLVAADNGSPMFERNFNPFLNSKRVATFYMYEPLVILDNVTGDEFPWLATGYEQPDPSTIVYDIRKGVTWQDGEPFTPEDVVFTFEMLKQYPAADAQGIWEYIRSVESDEDTVTVRLQQPDVPAASLIATTLIVPEHIWKDVEDPASFRNPDPVGTGPYMLGNYAPQQYTVDKYQDYWQADKVAAEHLILPAANTQLDVATKGYDWAYSFISDVDNVWVGAGNDNTYWFPPGGTIALFPNLTKAPFNDLNVRKGLSLALDRGAVGDAAAEGYMDEAGQTNILLPYQQDDLDPSIPNSGLIDQDTDAALAAFAEAGYTLQGDRLVNAAGEQLSLTITTANGYTDWLRGVQEVQRQWGAVGIDVGVDTPQPAAYQLALRNGEFDFAMGGTGGTGVLFRDFNALLSSDYLKPVGEEATNNFERYDNPAAQQLLDQYKVALDEGERQQIGYELQQIVYNDLPVISLYYGGSWGLVSNAKFTGWPSAEDPYASPKTYESTPLIVLTNLKAVTHD
ncbi:peptide/nickel transport system substrate-binding protein [Leifsonia sp. AK011]|uniref:ABC transporter substrate-binding protein n=1 Tax=Leifsonia sp. AK011 TaxID=2723075 RepID=UPI0015C836F2|nr:ABC transporter substrate-binding protein [Leifsonia sp. AK011]NYF11165.1 peptide/nickel transport system substrate-binding protein [Leifsonia sp. AK011]